MSNRRRADSTRRWLTRRPSVLLALTGALVITGLVMAFGVLTAASDRTPSESTPATVDAASGCEGIRLEPGNDPQAQLQSQPEGATFCLSAGVYRLVSPLTPKDRQRLVGEPGAILSGAQGRHRMDPDRRGLEGDRLPPFASVCSRRMHGRLPRLRVRRGGLLR